MKIIKFLIYFLIATVPLGIFSRFEITEKNISFYSNDLLIATIVFLWLLYVLVHKQKIYIPKLFIIIAGFILTCIISLVHSLTFLSPTEVFVSSLYLIRFVEYVMLGLVIGNVFRASSTARLEKLLVGSALVLALLGFVQFLVIPDFSSIASQGGWDPHQYRLLSTFFDPNFLGLYLTFAFTFLVVHILHKKEKNIFEVFSIAVLALAIVLTYSRSSYLGFLSALIVLGILRWRAILVALPLLGAGVALVFPRILERFQEGVSAGTSGEARLVSWQNALEVFRNNPVLGVGFNTYRYIQISYGFLTEGTNAHSGAGTDSSFMLILSTTGIVGISFFVLFVFFLILAGFKLMRKNIPEGYILVACTAALLVHSQFVNSLFFPWILEWFWIFIGISVAKYYDTI